MTDWTDTTLGTTVWGTTDISTLPDVIYNSIFSYNADFLTYNGDYYLPETDWVEGTRGQTVWQ